MEKNQKKANMSPFHRVKRCGGLENCFWTCRFLFSIVCFTMFFFPFFSGFNDSDTANLMKTHLFFNKELHLKS